MFEEEKKQSSKSHFICISFSLHKKEKSCFKQLRSQLFSYDNQFPQL